VTFGLMALLEIAPAAALAARERVTQTSLEGPLETPVWTLDLDFDGEADLANPTHATLRTADAYGAGHFGASRDKGRRKHEGADFMVAAGAPVWSPLGGEVTEIGYAYADDRMLRFIEIKDAAQAMSTRVFYVDPAVKVGDLVKAGDKIGAAENLALRYPGGMTNHIHIELCRWRRSPEAQGAGARR
jgi:peptidoglycan LD-endopeptidase LytH